MAADRNRRIRHAGNLNRLTKPHWYDRLLGLRPECRGRLPQPQPDHQPDSNGAQILSAHPKGPYEIPQERHSENRFVFRFRKGRGRSEPGRRPGAKACRSCRRSRPWRPTAPTGKSPRPSKSSPCPRPLSILAAPQAHRGYVLLDLATQVLAAQVPGVATNILNTAVQLAVTGLRA